MALFDEDLPAKKPAHVLGEDLAKLSIDELEERVNVLKREIARLEEAAVMKRRSLDAAAAIFKR